MMELAFRPLTADDVAALYHVKLAAFRDEFELFGYAQADDVFKTIVADSLSGNPQGDMFSMKWHKQMSSFGDYALVIEYGGKIIGSIVALPGKYCADNYPGYDMTQDDCNVILCIYVLPEYKNKGVGAAAMAHMERAKPAKKWILDTPDVSGKNKRFYEKCGYSAGEVSGPNNVLRIYAKGFD